jgi:MFS family permease
MKKVTDFFAINRSIMGMLLLVILVGLGEKMAERFLPLYLLALGGSVYAVGTLNALDNLLSALYSFPGGYLSDKLGYKRALIVFTAIAMVGYVIVIVIPSWVAVFIGSFFFISWTAVSLPAVMSLVSKAVPKEKRTMGVSVHSLVRRIPMALGPVLGGIFIGTMGKIQGIRVAFLCALGLAFVAMFAFWKLVEERPPSKPLKIKEAWGSISPALRNLLISDILIRFAEQIPYAFVVVWVVEVQHFTALQFGILTTIEMVTAMIVYVPIAYLADRTRKKPFVLMTFVFFTFFPLALVFAKSFTALVFVFILRGLKEFGEPTRKSLIMDLAPEDKKAATFGTYYLIRDVIVSIAALSSAFWWSLAPEVNFIVAFGCGIAGTVYFLLRGKDS